MGGGVWGFFCRKKPFFFLNTDFLNSQTKKAEATIMSSLMPPKAGAVNPLLDQESAAVCVNPHDGSPPGEEKTRQSTPGLNLLVHERIEKKGKAERRSVALSSR